jgi:GT2 family glycosyltransferase
MVSVIIVTIGAKDFINSCLGSLQIQTHLPYEIIIIDNSCMPDFSRKIRKLYPSVTVHSQEENLFYAVSLNKGIELSKGEFILCLNDDVVLDKEFIREALKALMINNRIGMVSGKILRQDKKTLDSTGLFLSIYRTAQERGYGRADQGQFEKAGLIFGVCGAVAFYRKKMLEEIKEENGYFDPGFRMFYEDLDVSWRANKCGWQAYYVPSAVAYHVRGGSFRPGFGIDKAIARKYLDDGLYCDLIKNRYLAVKKNETLLGFFMHLIPMLIYDFCAWVYILFSRPKIIKVFFSNRLDKNKK